jgi:hypothetical protein
VNLGFLEAGGDLVAVVHTSLALPPDWLKRAVEAFQGRAVDAGAVACPVHGRVGWEGVEIYNVLGQVVDKEAPYPGGEPFQPHPGAVLYRRRLFLEGLYDEEMPAGPDAFALGWRLRAMGYKLYWAFEAKVLKPGVSTVGLDGNAVKADFEAERRRWAALLACAETTTLLKLFPLLLADALWRPFTRWFHPRGSFWGTAAGTFWSLVRSGTIKAVRGRNGEKRRVADKEVTRYLSGRVAGRRGLVRELANALAVSYLAGVGITVRNESPASAAPRR